MIFNFGSDDMVKYCVDLIKNNDSNVLKKGKIIT